MRRTPDGGRRHVGFKDLFSSGGRGRARLERSIKTTTSQYAQSPDRYLAMERLLEDGSTEALVGLLRRFTIAASKSIEDEEEKGWVYRRLCALGKEVLPALREFSLKYDNIAWALRILEEVANEDEEWEMLDALVEDNPPEYARDPSKKIQVLTHIFDIDDPRVSGILARFLADPDEGVRYFAADSLVKVGEDPCAAPLVAHLLAGNEDSLRIKTRIQDGLAEHGWDLSAWAETLPAHLDSEHRFEGNKVIKV